MLNRVSLGRLPLDPYLTVYRPHFWLLGRLVACRLAGLAVVYSPWLGFSAVVGPTLSFSAAFSAIVGPTLSFLAVSRFLGFSASRPLFQLWMGQISGFGCFLGRGWTDSRLLARCFSVVPYSRAFLGHAELLAVSLLCRTLRRVVFIAVSRLCQTLGHFLDGAVLSAVSYSWLFHGYAVLSALFQP